MASQQKYTKQCLIFEGSLSKEAKPVHNLDKNAHFEISRATAEGTKMYNPRCKFHIVNNIGIAKNTVNLLQKHR